MTNYMYMLDIKHHSHKSYYIKRSETDNITPVSFQFLNDNDMFHLACVHKEIIEYHYDKNCKIVSENLITSLISSINYIMKFEDIYINKLCDIISLIQAYKDAKMYYFKDESNEDYIELIKHDTDIFYSTIEKNINIIKPEYIENLTNIYNYIMNCVNDLI